MTESNKVKSISEEALVFIEHYAISKTPNHYTIAYEYAKGDNEGLVHFIDDAIFKQTALNDGFLEVAFNKYIRVTDDQLINNVQDQLNTIVKDILSQVDPFSKLTNLFEEKMLEAVERIREVTSKEALEEVVTKVAQNTKDMNEASSKLNTNLNSVAGELLTLKKTFAKVKEEALTDSLTQILNRRGLENQFEQLLTKTINNNQPLSLLIIDVDYFKKFNDTFGHLIGDEVLKYIALSCKKRIRPTDIVSRFGGEEFVIVLPDTSQEEAIKTAEQIRTAFEKTKLQRKEEPKDLGKLTVSIGVSKFKTNDTLESIFERADKALYLAKEKGRNCVKSEDDL